MHLRARVVTSKEPKRQDGYVRRPAVRVWLRKEKRRDVHTGHVPFSGPLGPVLAWSLMRKVRAKLVDGVGVDVHTADCLLDRLWLRLVSKNLIARPEEGAPHRPDTVAGQRVAEWQREKARFRAEVQHAANRKD